MTLLVTSLQREKSGGFKINDGNLGCSHCVHFFPGGFGCEDCSGFQRQLWSVRHLKKHIEICQKVKACKTTGDGN